MHSSQYKILIDSRSKQIFQSVLQPPLLNLERGLIVQSLSFHCQIHGRFMCWLLHLMVFISETLSEEINDVQVYTRCLKSAWFNLT
jgi:hypothetical protein